MASPVSVLLLGEGEIDRVERTLERMAVPFRRIREPRADETLDAPEKLLVISGRCLSRLPHLETPEGNEHRRVCIHGQDFLPLRERLREKGFHYLVQSALDATSLRVFLGQLLHRESAHRSATRLPLGGRVEYEAAHTSGAAQLGDLTAESCRILGADDLSVGDRVVLLLPAALGGGRPLPLPGEVIRASSEEPAGERRTSSTVVRFSPLEADAGERLARLVRGELIGARVTPLAEVPPEAEPAPPPEPTEEAPRPEPTRRDRRREVRHPYSGRVEVMELPGDAEGALGRDLSLEGICIAGEHRLKPGMKVTLALYGGRRSAPVVVEAEAIRVGSDEAALVFGRLSGEQQDDLAMLIAEQPALESLACSQAERVVATRILQRNS